MRKCLYIPALLLLAAACSGPGGFPTGSFAEREPFCDDPAEHDNGLGECVAVGTCADDFRLDPEGTCSGWVEAPPLEPARFGHSASMLPNGHVLIVGGYDDTQTALTHVSAFSPILNEWTEHAPKKYPTTGHQALPAKPIGVHIVGGYTPDLESERLVLNAAHERFDPRDGAWHPIDLEGTEYSQAVALSDRRILFLRSKENPSGQPAVEGIVDPVTGAFTEIPPMHSPRMSFSSLLLKDGRVLIAGGWTLDSKERQALTTAEIFDPQTLTWTHLPEAPTARAYASLTQLDDTRVLIAGGQNTAQSVPETAILHLNSETWELGAPLNQPRSSHTATLLKNGRVLITGGIYKSSSFDPPTPLGSTEIYDPLRKTWYDTGALREPRLGHTATRLKDGRVLVVGGVSLLTNMRPASAVELFTTGAP